MADVADSTREITRSFTAYTLERGNSIQRVVFPANVKVSIVDGPHPIPVIGDALFIAFTPLGSRSVYRLPEAEFYECTIGQDVNIL